MGEVYRARDSRLDRHVALKVLPRRLASSPELRLRFEREARAISALSHPHICALYDVGAHEGMHYLVMELLDGETLADRLSKGPLPIEQVLRYGVEIASALDRAHRDGMIHRDLKPGNVMLTRSGAKLLDFGLARFAAPAATDGTHAGATEQRPITTEGTMLGTFQYMAPEQIEGREADARSDIFAFGAVLYEMLTGRRAFDGRSRASVVAAVLGQEPQPISAIQPLVPPALDRVIRTCLAKDPEDRWQTAHDVMLQLRWIAEGGSQAGAPAAVASRRRSRERVAWSAVALLAVATIATGTLLYRALRREPPPLRSALPARTAQYSEATAHTLSPDGSFLLFIARDEKDVLRVWKRGLADDKATPLEPTDRAVPLLIAPDGRSFLVLRRQKLWRVDMDGGTPVELGPLPEAWGGSFVDDSTLIYSSGRGLWRVRTTGGGQPEALLEPSPTGAYQVWPEALPGGRKVLYVELAPSRSYRLHVLDLAAKTSRYLGETPSRTWYANGYLLAARDGSLEATPFDVDELKITGKPKVIATDVRYFKPRGDVWAKTSANGLLVYQSPSYDRRLRFFDREGRVLSELPQAPYSGQPAFSPDGRHLATALNDPKTGVPNIWIYGTGRATRQRLAFSDRYEAAPLWTPDRRWIIYQSDRLGVPDLYRRPSDGSGTEELLHAADGMQTPSSVSPDGKWVVFTSSLAGTTNSDLMVLSLETKQARPLVQTPAQESWGTISPDGKWLAHASDESGRSEVYVRPFLTPGERVQVSTGGGTTPRWSADGRQLYYLAGRSIMVADTAPAIGAAEPRLLFSVDEPISFWQVAPDGRFLIMTVPASERMRESHLIYNWPALLK